MIIYQKKTMKHPASTILTLLFLVLGIMLCACESDNNHAFHPVTPEPPVPKVPTEMRLYVNGEYYPVALPSTSVVDLRTLTTEYPATIRIENANDFARILVNGQPLSADGTLSLPIARIGLSEFIEILYETETTLGSVHLSTLHRSIPLTYAVGQTQIPGDFYLSFIWMPLIMKYANDGSILYYRFEPTDALGTPDENGFWDFKKHTFDGRTYYSYHAADPAFKDRTFTGYCPGMRVLLDDHYQPVDTIHALASLDGYLSAGEPLDGHDFHFFSPTHWISSSYVVREVNGVRLAVSYLQEVQDGKVVFDWWSHEHPEMATWCSDLFDTSFDYVHFNALQVLPDDNWLCSFRVLNSVLKVEHGTGKILWRIDGDSLSIGQRFYGQHYARLHDDGLLTLFDNGNGHTPHHTRLLSLQINPDTGEVLGGDDLLSDASGYFTYACGAFQRLKGGYVASWGWSVEDGNNDRLITEHDPNGNIIFELRHGSPSYLLYQLHSSYRCVKN